jgi:hypothetical protein
MPFTVKLEGIMFLDPETIGGTLKRATIQIEPDCLIIDGMRVTFDIIPQFMYEFAHPDPRKWYRLERKERNLPRPHGNQRRGGNDTAQMFPLRV